MGQGLSKTQVKEIAKTEANKVSTVDAYTKSESDAKYAVVAHNHDSVYVKESELKTKYAPIGHNHEGVYAPFSHNHDSVYVKESGFDDRVKKLATVGAVNETNVITGLSSDATFAGSVATKLQANAQSSLIKGLSDNATFTGKIKDLLKDDAAFVTLTKGIPGSISDADSAKIKTVFADTGIHVGSTVVPNADHVKGLNIKNGDEHWTHFNAADSSKNQITGHTTIRSGKTVGSLTVDVPAKFNGSVNFAEPVGPIRVRNPGNGKRIVNFGDNLCFEQKDSDSGICIALSETNELLFWRRNAGAGSLKLTVPNNNENRNIAWS